MADGSVVFSIEGDNSKLKKSLEDTTKAIEKESKEWDATGKASSETIGSAFEGMFSKIAASAAAAKIAQMLRDWAIASIDTASSLQEIQNVVDVTFGPEGSQKIERWAKIAQSRFGLTELQAKSFASTIGSIAKSTSLSDDEIFTMSTDLAGLAADIASFSNISFDEAFHKIRAGLTGETEPLKAIGFDVLQASLESYAQSLGLGKFKDMDNGQKYMLRYQYLMKQAAEKNLSGDFSRTLPNSYENQKRLNETKVSELQARTGEQLLPFAQQWEKSLTDVYNFLLGDDGIIVKGTEAEINRWLADAQAKLDVDRPKLNNRIRELASSFGIEEEEFEPGIFKTFEEFAMETIRTRAMAFGGREGEKYKAALEELDALQETVASSEAEIADLQAQLNKLSEIDVDTVKAGYDAAAGIAEGINKAIPVVKQSVDNVNQALSGMGYVQPISTGSNGSFASGLDYVPFDGFNATLHKGESILTAEESKLWRYFKVGSVPSTVDYDKLLHVINDRSSKGGNVYLDGETVGRVIADNQADSYRTMERSGFQA